MFLAYSVLTSIVTATKLIKIKKKEKLVHSSFQNRATAGLVQAVRRMRPNCPDD